MAAPLSVSASWDPYAAVWVAESDDVPGLVTESGTKVPSDAASEQRRLRDVLLCQLTSLPCGLFVGHL
jgi:hypothetical protein